MNDVFCIDCTYLGTKSSFKIGFICNHTSNKEVLSKDWLSIKYKYIKTPDILNYNNKCKNYKRKQYE